MRTKTRNEKFRGTFRGYHTDFTEDKEHGRQNWLHNLQVPVQENMPANLKTQQWPQDWKRPVFIPVPKKGNAKECSNYRTIASHMLVK